MEISIIKKAVEGDIAAFKKIFDYYVPRMRPVCRRYVQSNFEVDDILQESFVKIHSHLKNFKFEGSFEGWVRRTVITTSLNQYKKYKSLSVIENIEEIEEELVQEEWEILESIEYKELTLIIEKLPQGYKIVFTLYVVEDYSHKEIADLLGITEGSSRSQYAKAKKMIKRLLSGNEWKKKVIF